VTDTKRGRPVGMHETTVCNRARSAHAAAKAVVRSPMRSRVRCMGGIRIDGSTSPVSRKVRFHSVAGGAPDSECLFFGFRMGIYSCGAGNSACGPRGNGLGTYTWYDTGPATAAVPRRNRTTDDGLHIERNDLPSFPYSSSLLPNDVRIG
jgi:hypothetical protein